MSSQEKTWKYQSGRQRASPKDEKAEVQRMEETCQGPRAKTWSEARVHQPGGAAPAPSKASLPVPCLCWTRPAHTSEPGASHALMCTGITWKLHLNSKSETAISGWGLRLCISNKLPSNANAACLRSTDGREGLEACDSILANSDFYFLYNLWFTSLQEISLALSLLIKIVL